MIEVDRYTTAGGGEVLELCVRYIDININSVISKYVCMPACMYVCVCVCDS